QFLSEIGNNKVLLICSSMSKAIAIEEALLSKLNVKTALFHEDLTLLQRDRNSAYFANPEGARILICSEIGSEGRNFQFAEHLVLFDLPYNLELLEQRIGRLDRIGRKSAVSIVFPFILGSSYSYLARWYHYALDCFEHNHEYADSLKEWFDKFSRIISAGFSQIEFEKFIEESRLYAENLVAQFQEGRDELLELTSFNEAKAAELVKEFEKNDDSSELEEFVYSAFDSFGIRYEDGQDGTVILSADDNYTIDLPEFSSEGSTVTFKREVALSREDVQFLSWDHPLVCSILEMCCATPLGNSSFAFQKRNDGSREIILEVLYVFEAIAPARLHINRFFPAYPIKSVYNHLLEECSSYVKEEGFYTDLRRGNPLRVIGNSAIRDKVIPQMLEKSLEHASLVAEQMRVGILEQVEKVAKTEITRLKYLQKINPSVTVAEIKKVQLEYNDIKKYISEATVRLDMLRLIYCGDKLK
ncbi:MAG: helicase-related protein, partial [Lentisphaeria bacterium]